ncbi:MAG: DNA polymerase III subunit delta' [Flavobacteriales bacterium]|nr:DNA polymerase III subunit delta' [Flavobacteriales bacterium]
MNWNQIVGQQKIINDLQQSINENRISHAQLFVGNPGYGTLPIALAYATEILKRDNPQNEQKIEKLMHADLHFSFPTVKDANHDSMSKFYQNDWKEFLQKNPYGTINDWYNHISVDKKQGIINVKEMEDILSQFSLKSLEGGFKVMIIWMVDKMHESSANKFLKLLEEPPEKSLFILVTDDDEKLLPTITSRCQITKIPRIEDNQIQEKLQEITDLDEQKILDIVKGCNGDWNQVQKMISHDEVFSEFESYLIDWTRSAFRAKKNPKVLRNIHSLSETLSSLGREKQKQFLNFSSEIFRQALMQNYQVEDLVYRKLDKDNFNWKAFSGFIHGANIEDILEQLNEANYHIERNANSKIIFLNLLISLTRYIHASNKV